MKFSHLFLLFAMAFSLMLEIEVAASNTSFRPLTDSCDDMFSDSQPTPSLLLEKPVINQAGKSITFPYKMPVFPPSVQLALQNDVKKVLKTSRLRRLIVNAIADDILNYGDGYFTTREYENICSSLISKYPELSDKNLSVNAGVANVMPYATWLNSLKARMKYLRLKVSTPSQYMEDIRLKYGRVGSKRKTSSNDGQESNVSRRSDTRLLQMDVPCVEDSRSIQCHKTALQREWSKKTPDLNIINDRMTRTVSERAPLYSLEVAEVMNQYCMLQDCHQMVIECERLMKINTTKARQMFFEEGSRKQALWQAIKNCAKSKKVANMVDDASCEDVLLFIPLLFKESLEEWFVIDADVKIAHPTVRVSVGSGSVLKPDIVEVYINQQKICCHEGDVNIGFDALIAAIYLWNFEHNPKLIKSYRFLAEVVYGFSANNPLPISVQRLVNLL